MISIIIQRLLSPREVANVFYVDCDLSFVILVFNLGNLFLPGAVQCPIGTKGFGSWLTFMSACSCYLLAKNKKPRVVQQSDDVMLPGIKAKGIYKFIELQVTSQVTTPNPCESSDSHEVELKT